MDKQQIKELVSIRNDEINNQIQDIKDTYDIAVTNELLEQLVEFSFNAIHYYNEKYNCFSGDEYEQLYLFGDDFYNTIRYNYNLLNAANYMNENYIKFIKLIQNNEMLQNINYIYTIIQMQIEVLKNKNIYIQHKTRKIDMTKVYIDDKIIVNLPTNETILYLIYYYLNNKETSNNQYIINDIKENIKALKLGTCNLFEKIYFNFADYYEITNMKSEYFLEILEQNSADYNLTLHQNLLKYIEETM